MEEDLSMGTRASLTPPNDCIVCRARAFPGLKSETRGTQDGAD